MDRGRIGEERAGKETDGCPLTLCSLFRLVKEKLTVECILDSGCQIVAMNNVIWEKLGSNL
jgi:hypothetical protein